MRIVEARQGVHSSSLTVLQVTPALDAGGVERTTVDIAAAIVAAGGRALVASEGGRLEGELAQAGGELHRLPAATKNPALLAGNAVRLARLIRREDASLVHARSRAPAWSAMWAARLTGRPFVTTYAGIHNARTGVKRFYNSIMARGDVVIANSRFTAAHLGREHGTPPERVTVIPRGVDVAALSPTAVSAERLTALRKDWGLEHELRPIALLPGRLTRWKGQMVAIEALAALRDDTAPPPCVLVLLGDDQGRTAYRDALVARAEALGVAADVTLPGHGSDMPAAYALADLVISASTDPEAFGRVAVEAQCMERLVIATDHGGAQETVLDGETGYLVAPGDSAALAEALRSALSLTAGERLSIGEKAAKRARLLFSVAAMQEATLNAYRRLLEAEADDA